MAMGKFVIKKTDTGLVFHLVAGNGEVIGTSEVYRSMESCKNGIKSVIKNSGMASVEDHTAGDYQMLKHPKFEIYLDKSGRYRFRMKATNGQEILASQAYKEKAGCEKGIDSVIHNAKNAPTVIEKPGSPE